MYRSAPHLIAAILAVTTSLPVTAPVAASEPESDALCPVALRLSADAARLTSYPAQSDCPDVGFGVLPAAVTNRSQAGAYFPETGRIELAPDLDLSTVYGQSFLLHELVHAAQYRAGTDKTAACPAALEAEAYQAQAQFLIENGLGQEGIMTAILGSHLGQCGASDDAY